MPACGGAVRSVGAVPRWGAAAAPVRCMSSMEEAARLPLDMLTEEETMMQEAGTVVLVVALTLAHTVLENIGSQVARCACCWDISAALCSRGDCTSREADG